MRKLVLSTFPDPEEDLALLKGMIDKSVFNYVRYN